MYNKTCTLSTLFGYISGYKTGYIHFYSKNIKNDKDIKKLILIPNTLQLELLFISQHGEIAYHGKHVSHSTTDLSCLVSELLTIYQHEKS